MVGVSHDYALADSVVGLYKTECVKIDGPFRTADELATLSWVHWFNENRLHSSIGYLTPLEKENEYYRESNPKADRCWENQPSTNPGAIQIVATGHVQIEVPRDRDGTFDPVIVKKRQRRLNGVDEIVLSLYANGLTTGEISAHFAQIYGASVSKETISRITDEVIDEMNEWSARPLDEGQFLPNVANWLS
jgi:hypothetical protein